MFFKMTSKNPYRNLVRNARRISISSHSDEAKLQLFHKLHDTLKDILVENERYLNTSPAFSQRCEHWNQREVISIKPVKNLANPWLYFKHEFVKALTNDDFKEVARGVSIALGWFYSNNYRDDWVVD